MGAFDSLPTLADQGRCAKPKGDEPSRHDLKAKRKADAEANWRAVCKQVDARDGKRCRCCGKRGNPDSTLLLERLHRHHLQFKSLGGVDSTECLVTLCAGCHDAVHVKRTLRIEAQGAHGADGSLSFWRSLNNEEFLVKREVRPGETEVD